MTYQNDSIEGRQLVELHEQTQLLRSIRNMLTFIVIALVMFLVLGLLSAAAA
jgi:hypothetical protein